MKWTKIPESFKGLGVDELNTLLAALEAEVRANIDVCETTEDIAEWDQYATVAVPKVRRALAAAEAEAQAEADREAAEAAAEEAAAEEESTEEVEETEEVAAAEEAPVATSTSVATVVEKTEAPALSQAAHWKATDVVDGKRKGEGFSDFREIAEALQDASKHMTSGSQKTAVAKAYANFTPEQILDDNPFVNLAKFEQNDEITAAMCAPLQPLYDLACANTARRPVRDSLPVFRSPTRGGFSVYPSPSLTDITTGYGQWTAAMDADDDAVKEACQTIECATPVDYRIYGVYRCLTVKNLLQMTFPELVEAYLNRLAAAQSRLAETLLLEAMGNGSVSIDAQALGYNATTTTLSTILNYLGLYQEIERWDNGAMEAWLPRWALHAIQMDQVRRRRTDGGTNMVPSVETVNGWFRDAGVNPHWYMDRPSWATPIPPLATASVLNFFPRNLEILIAPRGKFALMDRGELSIGVAPGNLYRDNASNAKNEFTLFYENFEGLIDTNTCPAHIIQINDLCYNGQQIADVAIDCEGADYAGIGS